MTLPLEARRYFARRPPRAANLSTVGSVASIPITAGAGVVDLRTLFAQAQNDGNAYGKQTAGVQGTRIVLHAVTATVGVICGDTQAHVSSTYAPSLSAQGTLNGAGVYTLANGSCEQLAPGDRVEFEPALGIDNFLGFIGSGSGTLVIYQVSDANS